VNDFGTHDTLDPALNETQYTMLLQFQLRNFLVRLPKPYAAKAIKAFTKGQWKSIRG
jgi:hypothetical protein